ncbi:hypothetical protein O1611_g9838 [Lasiodiplodia mahajangana]|uniref:Uncharacterized protein n=1 Tax=Lasiodiplodia mahajangana TaxID=1108764 RepID=A0ACC2J525_9PEZI|nr:hypothetical protein O1611_g9838 [Lasiodiplodia mahajangana]
MSLGNSVSVARASGYALAPRVPTVAVSRATAPSILNNTTSLSLRHPTRAPTALTSIPATLQPAPTPIWFNSTIPQFAPLASDSEGSEKPENERKVKLGKSK